jgi:hypothetical protein
MKNLIKVFGLIALVVIIGFSFAACSDGGGGGGGSGGGGGGGGGGSGKGSGYLTINDLPSANFSYSVYVYSSSKSIPDSSAAVSNDYLAMGVNGDKVFSLFVKYSSTKWTESGSFQVVLIKDSDYRKATVSFTNGSATVNYNAFTVLN